MSPPLQRPPIEPRLSAWHDAARARIPNFALAILDALRFDRADTSRLQALDDAALRQLLAFCDKAQLTLTLNHVCGRALPAWVRERIEKNLSDYSVRFARLEASLSEMAAVFESRGAGFVVLKGVAHSPDFTPDPVLRVQGDIDLWCDPDSVETARQALLDLGYVAFGASQGRHLQPMIRDKDWQWRGDHFASDLPIAVELHYELWDERVEAIPAPGERDFWERRITRRVGNQALPVLAPVDTLAFAAQHLMMHLLHGDLRLQRAWEIANFLHNHAHEVVFWESWSDLHPALLRRIEAIVFQLVSVWFGCELAPRVAEEIERLPDDVKLWIERYAYSPVEALFHPNKDEIWLQISLVERLRDRCAIVLRRVFPLGAPMPVEDSALPGERPSAFKRRLLHLGSRSLHHARALFPTVAGGVKWWWLRRGLAPDFIRFQAASALYSVGVTVFILLYNLYLLGLGFHENVLGRVSSAMSFGTLVGALPAAAIVRRIGLRNTILIAILGGSAAAFSRVLIQSEAGPIASAFFAGWCMALWAVSYAPAIAGLSGERNRAFAFSLSTAMGISTGIVGGLAGGWLPGAMRSFLHLSGPAAINRTALEIAAGAVALGAWPAFKLRFPDFRTEATNTYPTSPFLRRFLFWLCCWSLAVGAFNPFFNAYFSQRIHMETARIGLAYSFSQLVQVIAVLAAPMVLRRLGVVNGIAAMQLATGLALGLLAFSPMGSVAVVVYAGYMAFQYMSEPGMFQMLMGGVAPGERGGAAALYFLATSLAGSIAAYASGASIARYGYPATLAVASSLAIAAGIVFRVLIQEEARTMALPISS